MKKILVFLAFTLAAVMCIALVACGENGNVGQSTSSSSSSMTSSTSMTSGRTDATSGSSSSDMTLLPPMSDGSVTDGDSSMTESTGNMLLDTRTSMPIFARFDFGTNSRAMENSLTSHEYILNSLKYDPEAIGVSFTEDSMILTALIDGTFEAGGAEATLADSTHFIRGTKTCYRDMNTFAIRFDDMITFDFDDELHSGYGMWHNFPFTYDNMINDENWRGYHQFMKIRLKNPTDNTAIAMQFNNSTAFASTQFAVMSVGANKDGYTSYIYDLCYASTYPSGKGVLLAGQNPGNNWTWKQDTQVTGLRFHLLGSTCSYANAYLNNSFGEGESASDYDAYYEYFKRLDTRSVIKKGNSVEIDYIVFGSDPEELYKYHSTIEENA